LRFLVEGNLLLSAQLLAFNRGASRASSGLNVESLPPSPFLQFNHPESVYHDMTLAAAADQVIEIAPGAGGDGGKDKRPNANA